MVDNNVQELIEFLHSIESIDDLPITLSYEELETFSAPDPDDSVVAEEEIDKEDVLAKVLKRIKA